MRIIVCLDYTSFTEKILTSAAAFVKEMKDPEIYVVHIIDQSLFVPGTGFEIQLNEELQQESKKLKELAEVYLSEDIKYIEEYGLPRLKVDEILKQINYDLLIVGTHARKNLGQRLMGGLAEHLLRNASKPLLIIP